MGRSGSSLLGNFVILTEKIKKKIHKGNLPYWREIWSHWIEILTCLQGNKHLFQVCLGSRMHHTTHAETQTHNTTITNYAPYLFGHTVHHVFLVAVHISYHMEWPYPSHKTYIHKTTVYNCKFATMLTINTCPDNFYKL